MFPRLSIGVALSAMAFTLPSAAFAQDSRAQFMSFEAARPILQAMSASLPADLRAGQLDAARWAQWLKAADAQVRHRLEAGEEDTLTNLLRFGVTFTREYRIDDEYFARYGESTLVDSFAERRAHDLIQALAAPGTNPGFIEMRALLERHGFALRTAADRAAAKRYLLQNMARMHKEFLQAKEQAKSNRSQMFQDRGISLDSNLWPDYDLDLQLRRMAAQGMLKPGSVRKVAIVGPGLDFVNKQEGVDFYPPQSVQPFALLDSLLRLGLAGTNANGGAIEIHTLDISSLVNAHLAAARKSAAAGRPYTVQLPWLAGGRWSAGFRAQFIDYWRALGSRIGEPVAAIPVPEALSGIETRAVRIRPAMVGRVTPVDMNIVYQFLPEQPGGRFDLMVGTNIFLYYGAFEQSLARSNIAAMLNAGGYLLSNDRLAEGAASGLELVMTTEIPMTEAPVMTDYIFCYQHRR
jgi:hypothetical protein